MPKVVTETTHSTLNVLSVLRIFMAFASVKAEEMRSPAYNRSIEIQKAAKKIGPLTEGPQQRWPENEPILLSQTPNPLGFMTHWCERRSDSTTRP